MQVIFAGGASGVGASCVAIQLADRWIVVDAGVRVDRKTDPLPDLALLEGKDVQAIFVTHAHADHIGALPLVHQAFPTAPIYASRATGLLMEVMLADALKIMNKRAVEEMEIPLYPQELMASMLNQVRPLPVGEPFLVPELPKVTIHASRAGHIAGAICLGFVTSEGSIVVSGDISSTPQRTVLGAVPPPVEHPDLLVLESTYGARLHPNRQAEEQRLAQAVAENIASGGHTLIPCFGLGRGQEILLLLQSAQQRGEVSAFPIYVDGLVRRVCSTYQLLPEALTPTLQRQIRKGFTPFVGTSVSFVRDVQERERILAGPPACILSSSGMLTGGPSVWYASRLAGLEQAAILITGYQDEESPGKKLLDVAEKKQDTLEMDGKTVQVRCRVAKYNLSAHADGSELAAYAATLKPKRVALVHGDDEARRALRGLLTDTEILLPRNGETLEIARSVHTAKRTAKRPAKASVAAALQTIPTGIGNGVWFNASHLEQLWHALLPLPDHSIVTVRELVRIWYGDENVPEHAQWMLDTLDNDQPYDEPYFVRQPALKEAFRVRQPVRATFEEIVRDLVGQIVLVRTMPGAAKPVLCRSIEPNESLRVLFPRGEIGERTRFPLQAILDVIGPLSEGTAESEFAMDATALTNVVRTARRIRKSFSAHQLAQHCTEDATYTLSDLCNLADVSERDLTERLALAKLLQKHPQLFLQQKTFLEGEGKAQYALAPTWQEALAETEVFERPDQTWILSVIEKHIGNPPDLYKRSINPDTGNVTLAFHFPDKAWSRYEDALNAAAEEADVDIVVSSNAHQGELANVARSLVPPDVTVLGTPSIYHEQQLVQLTCAGQATAEALQQATQQFHEETGWNLKFVGLTIIGNQPLSNTDSETIPSQNGHSAQPLPPLQPAPAAQPPELPLAAPVPAQRTQRAKRMNQHDALLFAQGALSSLPGYQKAGINPSAGTLQLRFAFPEVAQTRYAEKFAELQTRTGWPVRLHPTNANQAALIEAALRSLPAGLSSVETPSLYLDRRAVGVVCYGEADATAIQNAQQHFADETGWHLELILPQQEDELPHVTQSEAIAAASELLSVAEDFYQIGADPKRTILWLHFYFPTVARQHYATLLQEIEERTGWHIELHPRVHQKALKEEASSMLPKGVGILGKLSLHEESQTVALTTTRPLSIEEREATQQRFTEATGWHLTFA